MWTAVVILGLVGLLAWKAPRAFRWLLAIAGGLVLLAALVGVGLWVWEQRKAARIAAMFDSVPELPQRLSVWSSKRRDGDKEWGLFNISPDTAYRCYVRMVRRNPAGITIEKRVASQHTIEPLDSVNVTYVAMGEDWLPEVAGCESEVRGKATVDPVEALAKSEFFKKVTPAYQAELLRQAGAPVEYDEYGNPVVAAPWANDPEVDEHGDPLGAKPRLQGKPAKRPTPKPPDGLTDEDMAKLQAAEKEAARLKRERESTVCRHFGLAVDALARAYTKNEWRHESVRDGWRVSDIREVLSTYEVRGLDSRIVNDRMRAGESALDILAPSCAEAAARMRQAAR